MVLKSCYQIQFRHRGIQRSKPSTVMVSLVGGLLSVLLHQYIINKHNSEIFGIAPHNHRKKEKKGTTLATQ